MNLGEHIITRVCNALLEASYHVEYKSRDWWNLTDALTTCEDLLVELANENKWTWEDMKNLL